jgi:hypothetical protein
MPHFKIEILIGGDLNLRFLMKFDMYIKVIGFLRQDQLPRLASSSRLISRGYRSRRMRRELLHERGRISLVSTS